MSIENVNSAVEIVFPPGVFITTMPRSVAASTSTLSTPTPALPTTFRFGAASITFRVTFVSDRTTNAETFATIGIKSASPSGFGSTVTVNSERSLRSAMPLGETGSHINKFIK